MSDPERIEVGTHPRSGRRITIPVEVLDRHAHVIGMTGSGKSYFLYRLFQQLVEKTDSAFVFLDPKGTAYHFLRQWCYEESLDERLVCIDPGEERMICGVNPLHPEEGNLEAQAQTLADIILRSMDEDEEQPGPRTMEWTTNLLYLLMVNHLTFAHVAEITSPEQSSLRDEAIARLPDGHARNSWGTFQRLTRKGDTVGALRMMDEYLASVTRRIRKLVTHDTVRRMVCSPSSVDWARILDEQKIVLVNLSHRSGFEDEEARLLGMQVLEGVMRESFRREDRGDHDRPSCYFFIDECQNFVTRKVEKILAEGRGFNLRLILAHQTLSQLERDPGDRKLWDLVNENTQMKALFRIQVGTTSDFLVKTVFGPSLDLMREKRRITQKKQLSYVTEVVDHASSSGYTAGFGSGDAEAIHYPGGFGFSPDFTSSSSTSQSRVDTSGETEIRRTAVLPGEPFDEVTNIEGMSVEEQLFEKQQFLARLERSFGYLFYTAHYPVHFKTTHLEEPGIDREDAEAIDFERMQAAAWCLTAPEIDTSILTAPDRLLAAPAAALDVTPTPIPERALPQSRRKK